jgi:hypothetical protein
MRKPDVIGGLIFAAFLLSASSAQAGPWEDGMAAYNRGDYLPPSFTAVSASRDIYLHFGREFRVNLLVRPTH